MRTCCLSVTQQASNWERNVRWVAAAGGQVVPELNCRHGRRLAKRKVRRKVSRKSRSALR